MVQQGGVQADMKLEKELRVLHLGLHAIGSDVREGDLKVHPLSDTLPPTRPSHLIVLLSLGPIFFQTTTFPFHNLNIPSS